MNYAVLVGIGLVAGLFAGMFGIGGGVVIVPALIFFMKMSTQEATGTSLAALIPPVGLLGAYEYYKNGSMNLIYAATMAGGLFVGAFFGARIVLGLPKEYVTKMYGVFLLAIGARMLLTK